MLNLLSRQLVVEVPALSPEERETYNGSPAVRHILLLVDPILIVFAEGQAFVYIGV